MSNYPDDVPLEELLSSETIAGKFMPRVKDLLKYVPRDNPLWATFPKPQKREVTVGSIKADIARFVESLGKGDFPDDLK